MINISGRIVLENHIDDIIAEQGFLKNRDDVALVIKYINRSFVPRSRLSDPKYFKKANKLLASLKNFLHNSGITHLNSDKYKNIFCDYQFLKKEISLIKENKNLDLKEILSVNIPQEHVITSEFKNKKIDFYVGDNETIGHRMRQKEIHKLKKISKMFTGHKKVNRDVRFIIKLKKKYKTEAELNDDLYLIYNNWYQSKIVSTEKHVQFHNTRAEFNMLMPFRVNKSCSKYFLSQDLLMKYINKEMKCPKRFLKIVTSLRGIKNGKSLRNNTYIDKLVENISVVSSKEDTGLVLPEFYHYKLIPNKRFWNWFRAVSRDLFKRGYLKMEDCILECVLMNEINYRDILRPFNWIPKYRSKLTKFVQVNKKLIINTVMDKYLGKEEEYNIMLRDLRRDIRDVFSREEFKTQLMNYIQSKQPKIKPPIVLMTPSFGKALSKDPKVSVYLDDKDKMSLSEVGIDFSFLTFVVSQRTGLEYRQCNRFLKSIGWSHKFEKPTTELLLKYCIDNFTENFVAAKKFIADKPEKYRRGMFLSRMKKTEMFIAECLEFGYYKSSGYVYDNKYLEKFRSFVREVPID